MQMNNLPELTRQQIFADPQAERFECAAGTQQLQQFLESGKLGKGFAVLSSASIYCKGNCYIRKPDSKRQKRSVEYRVDIPDISHVNYVHISQLWLMTFCLFFGLMAPVLLLLNLLTGYGDHTALNPLLDAGVCAMLSAFFALEYSMRKKTLLQFTYSHGSIALNTQDLPEKEEQLLAKRLNVLRREWRERYYGIDPQAPSHATYYQPQPYYPRQS